MNTRTTVAIAIIATMALAGCGGGSSTPPPPATGINGLVSALLGGALDEYVMVSITPAGGGATQTFAAATDGTYTRSLAPGDYNLSAVRPGYEDYPTEMVTVPDTGFLTHNFALTALLAGVYIGTDACGTCHATQLTNHLQSGHPYKINKVVGGVPPTYPFTSVAAALAMLADDDQDIPGGLADPGVGTDNPDGTPMAWSDIGYVIGGYHWKARFISAATGEIVTGTQVQYNLVIPGGNIPSETITAYHNNENDKSFNCGNCHTTGWRRADVSNGMERQDDLAGMDGTFEEGGIRCEACHGAGSTHAQTELATDITKIATARTAADFASPLLGYGAPIACGECHTRDGEKDYPTFQSAAQAAGWNGNGDWPDMGGRIAASGGLVRHHEQYDEVLGLDPNETAPGVYGTPLPTRSSAFAGTHGDCLSCHTNSHASTVNRDNPAYTGPAGVDDSNAACLQCHSVATYSPANNNRGSMTGLNCIDCHMPKTAKSATSLTLSNGVLRGDVTSHIFKIDLSGAPAVTSTGSFRYPYLTIDQACRQCHGSGQPGGTFNITAIPGDWISGGGFHPTPP